MTDRSATMDRAPDRLPILFIVDADEAGRAATVSALRRRFGSDYRVLAADSAEAGLAALEDLARQGEELALVGADIRLPETDGVEFLEMARELHPGASRACSSQWAVAGPASPSMTWRPCSAQPHLGGSISRSRKVGSHPRNGCTRKSRRR